MPSALGLVLIGNFLASCRSRYQLFSSKKPWASCWSRYHRVRWGRRRPTSSQGSGCSWSFPSFESGKFSSVWKLYWKLYWIYTTRLLGWLSNDYDRLLFSVSRRALHYICLFSMDSKYGIFTLGCSWSSSWWRKVYLYYDNFAMLSFHEVFSKLKKHSSLIYNPVAKFLETCARRSGKTMNWPGCGPLGNFPEHSNY